MKSGRRLSHAKLDDDAHTNRNFIRGQDFLTLDREFAFADIHKNNFDPRAPEETQVEITGSNVTAGFKYFLKNTVFVPEGPMRGFDNDLAASHRRHF